MIKALPLVVEALLLYLSARTVINAVRQRWEWQTLLPTGVVLVITQIWWLLLSPPIGTPILRLMIDLAGTSIILWWLDQRWLNAYHRKGPWRIGVEHFSRVLAGIIAQFSRGGRCQDRLCPVRFTEHGTVVREEDGAEFMILAFDLPERPLKFDEKGEVTELELARLALQLVRQGKAAREPFMILCLTRAVWTKEYERELRRHARLQIKNNPRLEQVLDAHMDIVNPIELENRDEDWRLPSAARTFVVLPYDETHAREIISSGKRMEMRIWRLNTFEVVALWQQYLQYEVLDLQADREAVLTSPDLRNLIVPRRFSRRRDGRGLSFTTQDGRQFDMGFAEVTTTGDTSLAVIREQLGLGHYGLILQVFPQDAVTEAHRLENHAQRTQDDLDLAEEYRSGTNHPVRARMIMICRDQADRLKPVMDSVCKGITSFHEGVKVRPVTGGVTNEQALLSTLPGLLAEMPAGDVFQPATELRELLIGSGNPCLAPQASTAAFVGQGLDTNPVFVDMFNTGESKIPANLVVQGVSGSGKSTLVRMILAQLVLTSAIEDLIMFCLKGEGEWRRFARDICPKDVQIHVFDLERQNVEEISSTLEQAQNQARIMIIAETNIVDQSIQQKLMAIARWGWSRQASWFRDRPLPVGWLDNTFEVADGRCQGSPGQKSAGVGQVTMVYYGRIPTQIEVRSAEGQTIFGPELIEPKAEFTFVGTGDEGELGKISILLDGTLYSEYDTTLWVSHRRTLWVVDEAWEVFRESDEERNPFGNFVMKVAKQCRSWDAKLIIITQDQLDLKTTQEGAYRVGEQTVAQCRFALIGEARSSKTGFLSEWGVPEDIAAQVPAFPRGCFLFCASGEPNPDIVRLHLTPEMLQVVGS